MCMCVAVKRTWKKIASSSFKATDKVCWQTYSYHLFHNCNKLTQLTEILSQNPPLRSLTRMLVCCRTISCRQTPTWLTTISPPHTQPHDLANTIRRMQRSKTVDFLVENLLQILCFWQELERIPSPFAWHFISWGIMIQKSHLGQHENTRNLNPPISFTRRSCIICMIDEWMGFGPKMFPPKDSGQPSYPESKQSHCFIQNIEQILWFLLLL